MTARPAVRSVPPRRAMVFAAGRGERMRPLTDERPKPLITLRGRSMLDTILDRLVAAGVTEVVINLHHLGHMVEAHLRGRGDLTITFSREDSLLETGGGVKKALPLLGDAPFYVINGDVCWLDGTTPALQRLSDAWDATRMDALLLLQPTAFAVGYSGAGDFMLAADGRVRRREEREVAPFVFAGLQILAPSLVAGAADGAYSLNRIYDQALARGRLWGVRHDGEWFHVGTPEQLAEAEDALHHLSFHAVQR